MWFFEDTRIGIAGLSCPSHGRKQGNGGTRGLYLDQRTVRNLELFGGFRQSASLRSLNSLAASINSSAFGSGVPDLYPLLLVSLCSSWLLNQTLR
jgi:hypothetical protein